MNRFECGSDYGNAAPRWVICTDIGGKSFLHAVKRDPVGKIDVVVWSANLDKAMRLRDIGALAEFFAVIPAHFEAYEEDDRFLEAHSL